MGKRRIGRTPMWPDYLPSSYPNRNLAILKGTELYDENNEQVTVTSFESFVNVLFGKTLLVFVDSIAGENFLWLRESIFDRNATVLSNEEGIPLAIRYERKHQSRWLVQSSTWDRKCDTSFLSDMRELYKLCGVVKPTPGSLGTSLLRKSWKINSLARQTAPNALAQEFLRRNSIGGRCDTLVTKESFFPELIELDGALFYVAHFLKLPSGTSRIFLKDHCKQFATYFAHCYVTIDKELPLGPFPIKRRRSKISYPTLPGTYETFLWKEEIDTCISAGCSVTIEGGFGWSDFTYHTVSWCQDMYRFRQVSDSDALADLFKKTAVSTLGHMGMDNTFYTLVPIEDASPSEACALDENFDPINYVVREQHNYLMPSMIHWFNYTIRMAALSLYEMALPYAIEGRLIMTNYDAIIVLERDERHMYAEKHSAASKLCELGDWRWQLLTNVTIHGDRSLTCDQKDTRPGVPVVGRNK
jgi:hypothetical protein